MQVTSSPSFLGRISVPRSLAGPKPKINRSTFPIKHIAEPSRPRDDRHLTTLAFIFAPATRSRRSKRAATSRQSIPAGMDVLKRELQRKRQLLDADFGGRKIVRRAEIEAREIQRIREAERQLRGFSAGSPPASSPSSSSSGSSPANAAGTDASRAEDGPNDPTGSLPREEVVRRLHLLRQPSTLFGEDDATGLQEVLEDPAALADVDAAEIGEGQTNDFLRDIQALRAKAAAVSKPKAGAEVQHKEGEAEQRDVCFEELCDEDKIAAFLRRLIGEWSQEVDEMPEAERRTAKGKAAVATCKQCTRYLEPLFKQCKNKV
jgi:pre-mRNA-splicing factor 18